MDANDIRELAVLDAPKRTFAGAELAPYTAARDAIVRTLAKHFQGLGAETDAWAVVFVLAQPVARLVELAREKNALQEAIIQWADSFPPSARTEVLKVADSVWEELHAVDTRIESPLPDGGTPKKAPPTLQS